MLISSDSSKYNDSTAVHIYFFEYLLSILLIICRFIHKFLTLTQDISIMTNNVSLIKKQKIKLLVGSKDIFYEKVKTSNGISMTIHILQRKCMIHIAINRNDKIYNYFSIFMLM